MSIDSAKVTVGVKIGVEGNFILAKSSASANIQVEMTLKPTFKIGLSDRLSKEEFIDLLNVKTDCKYLTNRRN